MTDYKRMVSYMYQYENGIKKKNVGYVRVEVKNGQCKFTIHMQLLGQSDSIFPTYLIHRDDSSLDLIYLGDSILKMQLMDSRMITDEANIMDSGYSLAQMRGVLIFMNNNIFFATVWDDKALNADELLEAMKPKNKKNIRQTTNDSTATATMISPTRDSYVGNKELIKAKPDAGIKGPDNETKDGVQVKKEDKDSISFKGQILKDRPAEEPAANEEKLSLEEELKIPTYKLPGGLKTIEMFRRSMAVAKAAEEADVIVTDYVQDHKEAAVVETDKPTFNMVNKNDEAVTAADKKLHEETENNISSDIEVDEKVSEIVSDKKYSYTAADNKVAGIGADNKGQDTAADKITGIVSDNKGSEIAADKAIRGITSDGNDTDIAADDKISETGAENRSPDSEESIINNIDLDRLMARFNRLYPFEDNEILMCVKIEPKDIGILPKQLWPLSSNSFLLHGYYCYHHLILAKMKYRDKAVYILGVPGLYQHREQFMARMFGFDCFKSIRKREPKKGDFGYWYLQINC